MYTRTSFRGAKTCKIGEKGVFGHIDKFWKGHDRQIKKNTCKNTYLCSIFIPEKYVFGVCFESPFTRMISCLKYKWPPRVSLLIIKDRNKAGLQPIATKIWWGPRKWPLRMLAHFNTWCIKDIRKPQSGPEKKKKKIIPGAQMAL